MFQAIEYKNYTIDEDNYNPITKEVANIYTGLGDKIRTASIISQWSDHDLNAMLDTLSRELRLNDILPLEEFKDRLNDMPADEMGYFLSHNGYYEKIFSETIGDGLSEI